MAGRGTSGAQQGGVGPAPARGWARRLLHGLVRRDAWSPDGPRLSAPQAARSAVRAEWTRSGDLTESQAATLLALDETTPWQA